MDCIFLTTEFPYNTGEQFIENEIDYLSQNFEHVFIFSLQSKTIERRTPENVKNFSLNISNRKFKKIKKLYYGLFHHQIKFEKTGLQNLLTNILYQGTVSLAYKEFKKVIKKNKIELNNPLIYSYWMGPTATLGILIKNNLFKKTKFITRCHSIDLYSFANKRNYVPYQLFNIKNSDFVFPISKHGENYLKNLYPDYKEKIIFSYLGTKHYKSINSDTVPFRILTCSHLIPLKRVEKIAEAIVSINDNDIYWDCFGDGPCKKEILDKLNNSNFKENYIFHGQTKYSDVIDFYKNHKIDLFINFSTLEGLPVSLMEAISFGVPCIATNVGATSEIINDSTGMLVDKNISVDELKQHMECALTSTKEYIMAREAQNKAMLAQGKKPNERTLKRMEIANAFAKFGENLGMQGAVTPRDRIATRVSNYLLEQGIDFKRSIYKDNETFENNELNAVYEYSR